MPPKMKKRDVDRLAYGNFDVMDMDDMAQMQMMDTYKKMTGTDPKMHTGEGSDMEIHEGVQKMAQRVQAIYNQKDFDQRTMMTNKPKKKTGNKPYIKREPLWGPRGEPSGGY